MPDLKDAFAKLKSTIVRTQTQKIDDKLDSAVKDILTYKSHGGRNGYVDLVKSLISKTTHDVQLGSGTGGDLFNQGAGPATFGQGGRVMRYKSYQAIVSNISYCFRALQVLVENILSPDDITKVSLEIKPIEYIEDEIPTAAKVKYIKEVLEKLGLEKRLDMIIRNTLLYGDFFCEIADPQTALTSRSILTEAEYNDMLDGDYKTGIKDKIIVAEGKNRYEVSIDYSAFVEKEEIKSINRSKSSDKKMYSDIKSLKDLQLVFHEPQHILRLQSRIFPICFGFLIFPPQDMINATTIADQTVNNICVAILKNLEKKIPQVKELSSDKELKDIIQGMLSQTDMNKALEIRYVPPDKMTHFLMPTTKYYPYGESIFDSTQYSSKVLIALETALAIQRLARSTEKRKIAIEVGLPRDARKVIESMKEEFRKRRVSLDSFGTVDTIPSMITTFEDVYIPQRDGKPFVDISTFTEGNVDTRSKVDEIKQMRDQLVASLGVPPAFIGIEENLCVISDTYIPLLNGFSVKLEEIIKQYESGNKNMYIYSYDNKLGKMVPGKIKWAGYTKIQTKCVRVWLDNDKYIDCTPDHPFMLRDGSYKEAQYLKDNESLMPFYQKKSYCSTSRGYYNEIYHPGINVWDLGYKENKRQSKALNHKVKRVELLEGLHDTGDITVENYHNFATEAGVIVHNSNKCIDLQSNIKLLNGKNIKLTELVEEFNNVGQIENKYTYSYDIDTGKIVPGKIIWAGVTRKNAKVVKVLLDNGKYEIVTPDHHYMLRDGKYIKAEDLNSGDSLMPLYTKLTHTKTTKKRIPYQLVYHPGSEIWQETHRMVAIHEGIVQDGDKLNVHHSDFNPLNNSPFNLEGLTNTDHLNKHIQHKQFVTTGRGNIKKENYVKEKCVICGKEYTRHIQNNQITCLDSDCIKEVRRINGIKSYEKRRKDSHQISLVCPFCDKEFIRSQNYIDNIKSGIITCGNKECYKQSFKVFSNTQERKIINSEAGKIGGNKSKHKLVAYNKKHGAPMKGRTKETDPELFEKRIKTFRENRAKQGLNHKVVSVEFLDYTIDTGDITVEKYNNFAVSSGVIISNSALSEENILFARTIIRYQKFLTEQINDLITKIFDIVNPEQALVMLDTVNISFPVPKSLQFERESRYMNELTNLIESLERIGVPKEYAKKRYLPQFDWEEIKKYDIDEKVEKALDPTKSEDDMGMGPMGGVGGAPMPGGEF